MYIVAEFWYVWFILYLLTAFIPYAMIVHRIFSLREGLEGMARTASAMVVMLMVSSGFGIMFLVGAIVRGVELYGH